MGTTPLKLLGDRFWTDDCGAVITPRRGDPGSPGPPEPLARGLVCFRTSGSEGRPKWVGLTRSALLASAEAVNAFLAASASDVWMRALPWHHVGGFAVEARAWRLGSRLVCDDGKWDPARFVQACARERVTLTSLVPTQVFDLVRAGLAAPPPLRAVVVGGGPLPPALWQRGRELGWPLLTSYGLTEAASQVATLAPLEPDPARLTVLPHWTVALSPDGCLELAGPALATCYFRQEAAGSWSRQEVGSRLTTSDRVALEPAWDGARLRFLGRRDRTVKILGELVDLNTVEAMLADAAIELSAFGLVRLRSEPDERAGCRLVLECLTRTAGERVRALVNPRLPAWARLVEARVVDDLHLSGLGKPVL